MGFKAVICGTPTVAEAAVAAAEEVAKKFQGNGYKGPVVDQAANDKVNTTDKQALLGLLSSKTATAEQIRGALDTLATDQAKATPNMTLDQFRQEIGAMMTEPGGAKIPASMIKTMDNFLKSAENGHASATMGSAVAAINATNAQPFNETTPDSNGKIH